MDGVEVRRWMVSGLVARGIAGSPVGSGNERVLRTRTGSFDLLEGLEELLLKAGEGTTGAGPCSASCLAMYSSPVSVDSS